jgi:adenine deaminase
MSQAAWRVRELDGGIVVVKGGEVVYELALRIIGMMSDLQFAQVVERNRRLSQVMAEAGYEHHDILYTLLFLTCDFLPALRLTSLGLLDVKSSKTLTPAERLTGRSDS